MTDIAAIEARHELAHPCPACDARLHEVEAERDAAVASELVIREEHMTQRDWARDLATARANAITPQQRAVIDAAVAWREPPRRRTAQELSRPESGNALAAAVDALLAAER